MSERGTVGKVAGRFYLRITFLLLLASGDPGSRKRALLDKQISETQKQANKTKKVEKRGEWRFEGL